MATDKPSRYERALIRNLNEDGFAILKMRAFLGLEATNPYLEGMDFFRLVYFALFNDMIAHSIKVLDRDSKSASFWYIFRSKKTEVESYVKNKGHDLSSLEALTNSLKSVRDETHFHIDRESVINPRKVWDDAGITIEHLSNALDTVFDILLHLHEEQFHEKFHLPEYDGSDVTEIIRVCQSAGILP